MCGIAGFFDKQINNKEEKKHLINSMLSAIKHRGPDFSDSYISGDIVLGHNRLSIIDLTDNGNQPMHYKGHILTYNGEIYNYLEIKKDLKSKGYKFKTNSDTEVIIAAYDFWGEKCVTRFIGMWAFVIWDANRRILFCSRDRFGIKPFYYVHKNDRFYFGSEYKAFQKCPILNSDLNIEQIYMSLQLKWTGYQSNTFYKNLDQIKPSHNLIFDIDTASIRTYKYWDILEKEKSKLSISEHTDKFQELFLDSIDLHLRSDVPVGGTLSGGLDSSAIASIIGRDYSDIEFNTFTIYYDGKGEVDERPYVKMIHDQFSNIHGYFKQPSDLEIRNELDNIINCLDVPVLSSSIISQYFVMKMAAEKGMKVLLDGQGSDEYLIGYMQSYYRVVADGLISKNPSKGLDIFIKHIKEQGYSSKEAVLRLLKSILAGLVSEHQLFKHAYKHYDPFLGLSEYVDDLPFHLEDTFDSKTDNYSYHKLFNTELQDLLLFEDRNSMNFSIESRVPFLDHRLVEFAFSVPSDHKVYQAQSKYLLREGLKKYLPAGIYNRRDKKGFVTPGAVKWLRGPLKDLVEDLDYKNLSMLNIKKAKGIIKSYKKGNNKNADLVWRLVMFNEWIKRSNALKN
ncbi:MAG: asparagine synthase (glutamine-hydrolyzing) [Saprospiraceae bacterium]